MQLGWNEERIGEKVRRKYLGKLLVLGSALVMTFSSTSPTFGAQVPTIAVIDLGANTSLFTNIVTEVCVIESYTCPNGKTFMEGTGAANTGVPTNKSVDHGTNMLSIINKVNPNVGLIPIRIAVTNPNGNLALYSNKAVKMALDWVVANRVKFNIVAVSVAQGKIFQGCSVPEGTAALVSTLKASNVPVIAAAGNNADWKQMMSIACLPEVISIGATDNPDLGISGIAYCKSCTPTIARYSNGNPTFYLNARWYVTQGDGSTKFTVGTSNATAAFAGWWTLNTKLNFVETLAFLNSTSLAISNGDRTGRFISIP